MHSVGHFFGSNINLCQKVWVSTLAQVSAKWIHEMVHLSESLYSLIVIACNMCLSAHNINEFGVK